MSVHDESAGNNPVTSDINAVQAREPAVGNVGTDRAKPVGIKGVSRSMLEAIAAKAPSRPVRTAPLIPTYRADMGDLRERARKYIAKKNPSTSGQRGHDDLMDAVRDASYGFDLPRDVAFELILSEFNPRCSPPWSEREINHKLDQVDKTADPRGLPRGHLRDARPAGQHARSSEGGTSSRLPLRNYFNDEIHDGETMRRIRRGRSIRTIAEEMLDRTSSWPKRCGPRLFALDRRGRPDYLRTSAELFAWMNGALDTGHGSPIDWVAGSDVPGKDEYRAGLSSHVDAYEAVELYPHEPVIPTHYYCSAPAASGDGSALKDLLSRFRPATPADEDLIRALLMSLVWGGPPGSRPAWVITARDGARDDGRGAGKTMLAQKVADVVGGVLTIKPSQDFAKWCDSYVSGRFAGGVSAGQRVVLIDNLKSLRFSSSDLYSGPRKLDRRLSYTGGSERGTDGGQAEESLGGVQGPGRLGRPQG